MPCETHARRLLPMLLTLTVAGIEPVGAQEKTTTHVSRAEMIDAIINYAGSGGCDTLRDVFGSVFGDACSKPGSGTAMYILALRHLHSQPDQALIEICTRNKLADCEAQNEVSMGRPILAFDTSFAVRAVPSIAAWSPDGRQMVIYEMDRPKGQTRLIDVERLRFGPVIAEGAAPSAIAWSPDGKYIALGSHQAVPKGPLAIRLFASDTFEEKASLVAAKENECAFALSKEMAFTPDSTALWITCRSFLDAPRPGAIAVKLKVPTFEIQDRLFPATLADTKSSTFETYAIVRRGDDLALTGLYRPNIRGREDGHQMSAQSFSLRTMEPLHPAVLMPSTRSISNVLLADDQSGVLVLHNLDVAELWSTEGRGRVDAGSRDAMLDRYVPPNRIVKSGMHIKVRYTPGSSRRTLVVLDSRSGDPVQEIGPVPRGDHGVASEVLVSPNGTRVAIFARREIRFYRVDLDAAAASAVQGR